MGRGIWWLKGNGSGSRKRKGDGKGSGFAGAVE
jgi:hypothetical protein